MTKLNNPRIVEFSNLKFEEETLKLNLEDEIEYRASFIDKTEYSSLYDFKDRFFILFFEDNDFESNAVYPGSFIKHRFSQSGKFKVRCLNYPRVYQTVIVSSTNTRNLKNIHSVSTKISTFSEINILTSPINLNQNQLKFFSLKTLNLDSEQNNSLLADTNVDVENLSIDKASINDECQNNNVKTLGSFSSFSESKPEFELNSNKNKIFESLNEDFKAFDRNLKFNFDHLLNSLPTLIKNDSHSSYIYFNMEEVLDKIITEKVTVDIQSLSEINPDYHLYNNLLLSRFQ